MHKLFEIPSITLFRSLSAVALAKADAFCVSLWPINPFNPRNLRLINDLRSTKDYVRKNELFMQNEPKFPKSQMIVNKVLTRDYDKMDTWSSGKKQSQTNPNKAKFKKAKMNVTSILTVGYENKSPIRAPKKQSQTSKRQKSMQPSLPQRIMKKPRFRPTTKQTQTNPIKANFRGKKMLPKARAGVIVEPAGCLKYDIAKKLLEREQLWLIHF